MNEEIKSDAEVAATKAAADHAKATGVDLTQVQGTGEGGKITKADVDAAAAARSSAPAEPSTARFRHTNDRSAIVDAEQSRYFVWAGAADDADALVKELNSNPDSAERFTWAGGDPTRPAAPAEQSAEV